MLKAGTMEFVQRPEQCTYLCVPEDVCAKNRFTAQRHTCWSYFVQRQVGLLQTALRSCLTDNACRAL